MELVECSCSCSVVERRVSPQINNPVAAHQPMCPQASPHEVAAVLARAKAARLAQASAQVDAPLSTDQLSVKKSLRWSVTPPQMPYLMLHYLTSIYTKRCRHQATELMILPSDQT